MSSIGSLSLVSSGLQLFVPSYAFRLIRRFGAESVGWFLVFAFTALAMLHLVFSWNPLGGTMTTTVGAEALGACGTLLLIVGMGHLETVLLERRRGKSHEQSLSSTWETRLRLATAELATRNQALQEAKNRLEQQMVAVREALGNYRLLFENNPVAMWVFDLRTLRLLLVNPAASRQCGFANEELLALTVCDLLPEEAVPSFLKYAALPCQGVESPTPFPLRRKQGSLMEAEFLGCDLKFHNRPARLVLVSDLEPRQRGEAEFRKAHRLEILAQVAGGFAHHFNNLLGIIETSASLLDEQLTDPQSARVLRFIQDASHRAAGLTQQLTAAAGRRIVSPAPTDLNGLLGSMSHLLRRLVGNSITIQTLYRAGLPPVLADPRALEHIVVNLVLNARDAMPQGGVIDISTASVRRTDAPVAGPDHVRPNEFIRLTIKDTGCGMVPEVEARLFEPFFTTKAIGQGNGLGLASVYGAVRQHSGWLEVTTEPGAGTECRIFLPCAAASVASTKAGLPPAATLGTVLLVEPDDRARGTARCVLSWNGFRVIEADSDETALVLWNNQASQIDFLMLDARYESGACARKLAAQLLSMKSDLRVVLTGDACPTDGDATSGRNPNIRFLAKPYTPDQLLSAVQGFFDRSPAL